MPLAGSPISVVAIAEAVEAFAKFLPAAFSKFVGRRVAKLSLGPLLRARPGLRVINLKVDVTQAAAVVAFGEVVWARPRSSAGTGRPSDHS